MDKTVVVGVEWRQMHLLYRRPVRRITKLYAHDQLNQSKVGDLVQIVETRPLSHLKRWRVAQILRKGVVPEAVKEESIEEQPAEANTPELVVAPGMAATSAPDTAPAEISTEGQKDDSTVLPP